MSPKSLKMIRNIMDYSNVQMAKHLFTTQHILTAMEKGERGIDQFTADAAIFIALQNIRTFNDALCDVIEKPIFLMPKHKHKCCIIIRGSDGIKPISRMNVSTRERETVFTHVHEAQFSIEGFEQRYELRLFTDQIYRRSSSPSRNQ